ncbi:hypothetical protein DXV65_22020 [Pseudomonas fluorescens]|nr:hypothetical protein DXV65_22020 [Pseudomonas fluorescens]
MRAKNQQRRAFMGKVEFSLAMGATILRGACRPFCTLRIQVEVMHHRRQPRIETPQDFTVGKVAKISGM